jgi:transposase-like protein
MDSPLDEACVKVKDRYLSLYRAADKSVQTIDFVLSAKRDADGAKRLFHKGLAHPHPMNPRTKSSAHQ